MQTLLRDLRFAIRQLSKEKGFLATAGLTMALCIGANTAIFSVINSVILRPLPVEEPERIVTMWNAYPGAGVGRGSNAAPDYFDRRALTDVFAEVAAYDDRGRTIDIGGVPNRIIAVEATPSFFPLLGARAALGRTFTEEEGEEGNDRVAVLSQGLWQQLYAGDPSVLGSDLRVDGEPFTVVGVMPRDFVFLDEEVRMWTALAFDQESRQAYHSNSWSMIARLQSGVSLQQAQTQIDALNTANLDKFPDLKPMLIDAGFHTPLRFLQEDVVQDVRAYLYVLWGGVAFVLLIGCVNVANLLLVRFTARAKELATRFALGASRGRIVRQLLTETLVLTLVGGALGVLVGAAGLRALAAMGIEELPRSGEIRLDTTAILFTLGLSLAVGLLVALIPVASVLRLPLTSVFREEGRTGTAGRRLRALRKGLVAAQVGLALILLVGAGLLMASFRGLLAIDPGFEPRSVLTGTVVLTPSRYPASSDVAAFAAAAVERIQALPGVETAGITSQIPFGSGFSDSVIFAEGYVMSPGESAISPSQNVITPGYFQAMGMDVLAGRPFDSRDVADGRRVIIIDERMRKRFFPDGEALGRRMWTPTSIEDITDPENAEYWDIVGVVRPIQMRGLTSPRDATGAYYFPLAQAGDVRALDLAIKTAADPASLIGAVRGAIADLDPGMPLFDIRTMEERISRSLTDRRTLMLLTGGFSAAALLLAAVGIYGVLAYLVQLRTREIGIRLALGSDASGIFRLVLREGVLIVGLGLAAGLAGAVGLRRLIESQLYGVTPLDPAVLGLVMGLLAMIALVACMLPARRATRIDPVAALTQE